MTTGRLFPMDVTQLLFGSPGFRIEEYTDGDTFVVRAEAPGVDPAKDIKVSTANNRLSIRIERTEERGDKTHSEFHYGAFARTIQLPPAVREDAITASYEHGILEVRLPIAGQLPAGGREIPVKLPGTTKK